MDRAARHAPAFPPACQVGLGRGEEGAKRVREPEARMADAGSGGTATIRRERDRTPQVEKRREHMLTREERYEQAESLKNEGRLMDAVVELEKLVADHADFALAHSALAAWCTRLERHEDAVRHARRVCELEPKDPFSFTALSVACMRGGRIAEAEEALARSRMLQSGG